MANVTRTAVSLEPGLLAEFDRYIAERGYDSRSEAVRDLIREKLSDRELIQPGASAVGVAALVYSHEELQLPHRLTQLQHHHTPTVVSTVHIHLDKHLCLEVVVLRGKSVEVSDLGNRLVGHRGVKYGKLFVTSVRGLER
ncbi:MAG: nickel-responsive transcriptional regulator NikR [Planctomycetes bacterium]|nr:nickel-responsive transcriptional regulator NikR [Planctomycetota bacterium]